MKVIIPKIIDKIKYIVFEFPSDKAAIEGPGQKPTIPQPIPNKADPKMSLESTFNTLGKLNVEVKIGFFNFFINKLNIIKVIEIEEIITKIKLGSQLPVISRNAFTLIGLTISETVKPAPKNIPHNKDIKFCLIINCSK